MSRRAAAWLAWSIWVLYVALLGFTWLLDLLTPSIPAREVWPLLLDMLFALLTLTYPTVGALVASRRPENPIGWIFLVTGLAANAFQSFALAYADYALLVQPSRLPGETYMAWLSDWIAFPFVALATVLLLLLFPSGRLPSGRWRAVAWLAVCGTAMYYLWEATMVGHLDTHSINNPVGIGGAVGEAIERAGKVGVFLLVVSGLFAALSLIHRLVVAEGYERQQLKWFVFATALMLGGFFLLPLFSSGSLLNEISWGVGVFGYLFFPIATGIAILRYRLYEIDLIINRTLVYGSLTLMLALVYFGGVTATQALFRTLTGQEQLPQLVVVASTLAIAALFNPLRRGIQAFIDRSFYRRKYDAAKTLEAFSMKLRDETYLEALNNDLVGVVRETMQPAHVSLWLRHDTPLKVKQED
jgi:hypothetical protein